MNQHVTLKFMTREDFDSLIRVINSTGYHLVHSDGDQLKIECHIDKFLLSISQVYLNVEIMHHGNAQ